MPDAPPLRGADFYDDWPPPDHRTGDIWHGLPTFGMLGRATASGVVVTPACDLANRKTETITYLPIVPVAEYLASPACRFECWQEIAKVLEKLPDFGAVFPPGRFGLITNDELDAAIGDGKDAKGRPLSTSELERLEAYRRYLTASRQGIATFAHVKSVFKADRFDSMLARLVTNAFKPDIHFLPADGQSYGARAVPVHSVALFRFPLSVPIALLDAAQYATESQWKAGHGRSTEHADVAKHMPEWPVKLASMKNGFLGDLISRYVGVHIRLGSDDFTEQTVKSICSDIGG